MIDPNGANAFGQFMLVGLSYALSGLDFVQDLQTTYDAIDLINTASSAVSQFEPELAFSLAFAASMNIFGAGNISPGTTIKANRKNGLNFQNEIADLLERNGYKVKQNRYFETPFGRRYIDIDVSKDGKNLGGIEVKYGGSRYTASQTG